MLSSRTNVVLILALVVAALVITPRSAQPRLVAQLQSTPVEDPLGQFQGVGVAGSVSWTGDGQRLTNPSFETGIVPWIESQSNTGNGSSITLTGPGYLGSTSAQLLVNSGNSSVLSMFGVSSEGLFDDVSQQKIGFNTGTRFRAAVQVQNIVGATKNDEVDVSLALATSTGGERMIHYLFAEGSTSPVYSPTFSNSTTDGYLRIPGFGTVNQWITIDRDVSLDASAVFSDSSSIDSVLRISLKVLAQTQPGSQNVDPHIRYDNPNSTQYTHWVQGLSVFYDADNNGLYDSGDLLIGCGQGAPACSLPSLGTVLSTDPLLKFVDSNNNGVWDCYSITSGRCTSGEAIVRDINDFALNLVGVVDYDETQTVIYNQTSPVPGTLLMHLAQGHTRALFDQVELYTATNGYDWVRNGGFEAGLSGWYTNSTFASSTVPVHSGTGSATASVNGVLTGMAAEMAQSIDAKPKVDASMTFKASVFIGQLTGNSLSDSVDMWIGLDDGMGRPLSIYYYFKTGNGTIPANVTNTVYLKATGFGSTGQWLSINANLLQTVQSVLASAYSPPYQVEAMVLEASASRFKTTTAFFDDLSLGSPTTQSGPAPSNFYARDGLNTTYAYYANSIPSGAFSIDVPSGRTVLNITSPGGAALQRGDYTTSVSSGIRRITVLDPASLKGPVVGDWTFFTSSTNGIARVYVEDPTSLAPAPSIVLDSTVNFVSQSKDPFNQPLQNDAANLTLWNNNGVEVGPGWAGTTSLQGWWNTSSITLPLAGTSLGLYKLQATVLALYPGVRTFQLDIHYIAIIDVSLSTNNTSAGSTVTISGTVTRKDTNGPAQDVNVTISYKLAGDVQWTPLATIKTDSSGKYTYNWAPDQGEYQVKATTSDILTGVYDSSPVHLIVNAAGLPWLIIIAGIAAAVAVAVVLVFLLQRRKKTSRSPLSPAP